MTVDLIVAAAWSSLALLVIVVLPGFALTTRFGRARPAPGGDGLLPALAAGAISVAVAGMLLVGLSVYEPVAILLAAIALAGCGVVPFARWVSMAFGHTWIAGLIALLALPAAWSAVLPGYGPAQGFPWYYWNLGTQIDSAGGVPRWVLEYGERVRWLPDYLAFNVTSNVYDIARFDTTDPVAMVQWRIPVAVLGLVAAWFVYRLWLSRPGAAAGTALFAASSSFSLFKAYRPEPFAVLLGLMAVWLVVSGTRRGRPGWTLLGGATIGVAVAVHPIAASVLGLLVASAGLVEVGRRRAQWKALLGAGVLAIVVVLASGWAVQGRVTVLGQAANPQAAPGGTDPTWEYLEFSRGSFAPSSPPGTATEFRRQVRHPWDGIDVFTRAGAAVGAVMLTGLVLLAWRGTARGRAGLASLSLFALGLMAVVAYFALAYDTFVPEHTGVVRFAQYSSLVVALFAGLAVDGFLTLTIRHGTVSMVAAGTLVVVALAAMWNAPRQVYISAAGRESLVQLEQRGRPGAVVLTNAVAHGSIDQLSRLVDPLGGRQPLIEPDAFLRRTNATLLAAHEFFEDPANDEVLGQLGVSWVLVVDTARTLGSTATLGGTTATLAPAANLEMVWSEPGIALLRTRLPERTPETVGSAVDQRERVLVLAGLSIAIGVVVAAGRRRRALQS